MQTVWIMMFVALAFTAVVSAWPMPNQQSDEQFDTEINEVNDLPDSDTHEIISVNVQNCLFKIKNSITLSQGKG